MKTKGNTPARKPYEKPELRVYGNVRTLTENNLSSQGAIDGGSYGMSLKTGG